MKVELERTIKAINIWGEPTIVWLHLFALLGEKNNVQTELNGKTISHNSQKFNLSLHSSAGAGKSWNTIDLLNYMRQFADIPFAKELHGRFTPKALIQELSSSPSCSFYVDESETMLYDKLTASLLRQMCFGKGYVGWRTSLEDFNIPEVRFEGNMIMSQNNKISPSGNITDIQDEHLRANLDRAIIITLSQSITDAIIKKRKQYDHTADKEAWQWITKRVVELRQNPRTIRLSHEETGQVIQWWEQELSQYHWTTPISLRTYDKIVHIFARTKLLFGELNSQLIEICKALSSKVIRMQTPQTTQIKITDYKHQEQSTSRI